MKQSAPYPIGATAKYRLSHPNTLQWDGLSNQEKLVTAYREELSVLLRKPSHWFPLRRGRFRLWPGHVFGESVRRLVMVRWQERGGREKRDRCMNRRGAKREGASGTYLDRNPEEGPD